MLGGISQGLTGKDNPALEFLKKQMDLDIKAQVENRDTKKSIYAFALQRTKDARLAMAETQLIINRAYEHELDTIASKYSGPLAKEKYDLMKNMLRAQHAQILGDVRSHSELQYFDPKRAKETKLLEVPGFGYASSPKDAELLKAENADRMSVKDSVQELLGMTSLGSKASTDDWARAELLQKTLVGAARRSLLGGGVLSDSDIKFMEGIFADPTKIFSLESSNKVRLQTIMRKMDSNFRNKLVAYGVIRDRGGAQQQTPQKAASKVQFTPKK
jgi:hypothetical protein